MGKLSYTLATFDVSPGHSNCVWAAEQSKPCAAEPWWVEALIRNPVVFPYTHGIRCLDRMYLDTTFAPKRHTIPGFPTKAEGLAELLRKVAQYPQDTIFHLHAWTYGYEDVWIALANALGSGVSLAYFSHTNS